MFQINGHFNYQMTESNDLVQSLIVVKQNDKYYLKEFLRGINVITIHQCGSVDNGEKRKTQNDNSTLCDNINIVGYETSKLLAISDRMNTGSECTCISIICSECSFNTIMFIAMSVALSFGDETGLTNIMMKTVKHIWLKVKMLNVIMIVNLLICNLLRTFLLLIVQTKTSIY